MKDEILQGALKQFLKYGIRDMSIQKLIVPLGISTKTVYKYFKNKEELVEAVLVLYYAQQTEEFERLSIGQNIVPLMFNIWYKGIEMECKVNKAFFQDLQYYYPELERKIEASVSKKSWKKITQIIQQGIREGVFRDDVIPEIFLECVSVLYTSIARTGQFKKFHLGTNVLFLNTIAAYIRGICTPEGIVHLDKHVSEFRMYEGINVSVN